MLPEGEFALKLDELLIEDDKSVLEAMRRLDITGHRILFVAPEGRLEAVVTDSDIRRYILRGGSLCGPVSSMANYSPKSITAEQRGSAKKLLLQYSIDALPVLSLQADHASRYQLRRSTRSEHFCTSEVAALCLALAGEAQVAAVLAAWLDVFTHHYQRAKHQLPADPTCEPHLHLQALCAAPAVQLP